MEEKQIKYLLAIAGLFHDIGKFYQRAGDFNGCKDYKDFKYQHACLSAEAIKRELKEGFEAVFSNQEIDFIIKGVYHHNPSKDDIFEFILQQADFCSSSERVNKPVSYIPDNVKNNQELEEEFQNFVSNNPRLISIFENLSLTQKRQYSGNFVYKLSPLDLNKETIFPVSRESVFNEIKAKYISNSDIYLGDYNQLWQQFKDEFNRVLKSLGVKFSNHPEKVFSTLYHLLYKYTWCVPASTYDKENYNRHFSDISLFDHSRVLSAVACCIYDYYTETGRYSDDEEVFLHLKGDISGIQNFIYTVYHGEGGVAKILRGKSFFVALLPDIVAKFIVNQLEYPVCNILYSGGGVFEIILGNSKKNIEKLSKAIQKVSQYLLQNFEGELGLSVAQISYTPARLKKGYKGILNELNQALDEAKRRKFDSFIENGEIFNYLNKTKNREICPACRTFLKSENKSLCENCKLFKDIGGFLPRTEYIAFSKKPVNIPNSLEISFGEIGCAYLLKGKDLDNGIKKHQEITEILAINKTDLNGTTGFKFMGKTVPVLMKEIQDEDDEFKEGSIAPFNVLAENLSDGDSRIGILRMDVDNLGKLFSMGFGDDISISRVATLSRNLDLFFSGYINTLCDEVAKKYESSLVNNPFYLLYAGGDDLFLISTWDKTLDIAKHINKDFRDYVCKNNDVTLSAGYLAVKPKYPIRISAEICGEIEHISKQNGKNRITAFGDIIIWDELEDTMKKALSLENFISQKKVPRRFIYVIHNMKEQFLKDSNIDARYYFPYKENINFMYFPMMVYYISRNIDDKDIRQKLEEMVLDRKNFRRFSFITNFVALKTRNKEDKDEPKTSKSR